MVHYRGLGYNGGIIDCIPAILEASRMGLERILQVKQCLRKKIRKFWDP